MRQGFLSRLRAFDWEGPVEQTHKAARHVNLVRRAASVVLRASALLPR